jgi:mycofactocin system creatininase family protein
VTAALEPRRPLADAVWPDVEATAGTTLVVVPIGSTEQHGPHLPLGTDTEVATALAQSLAAARDDVVVAPALPYGSSGEHAGFAGTLSIGATALALVVVELVRSADAFAGVVIVSGHGGNTGPLTSAVATLHREGRRVLLWHPRVEGGDAHAGRTETSVMLALRPDLVHMAKAERGDTRPLAAILPTLVEHGVAAVSPNGVLGDPLGARPGEGELLLAGLAADLAHAVQTWSET